MPLTASATIGTPTLWAVTIGLVLALWRVDFLLTRRPHEVSLREALGWSAFYVALPLAFGGWVWCAARLRRGRGVPHRLPGREVAERRQPLRLHAAARRVRGAARRCSSGCCSTASSARWCCAASSSPSARPRSRRSTGSSWSSALVLVVTGVKILRDALTRPRPGGRRLPDARRSGCCAGCCRSPRSTTARG